MGHFPVPRQIGNDIDLTIFKDRIKDDDDIALWFSYRKLKRNLRKTNFTKQEQKIYNSITLENGFATMGFDFGLVEVN